MRIPMADSFLPNVASDATVVKVAVVAAIVLLILGILDRGSSNVFSLLTKVTEWMDTRRRSVAAAETQSDDARVNDLIADVRYLKDQVSYLRRQMEERDRRARSHHRWDHRIILEAVKLDPAILERVGEPPSLYPEASDEDARSH